MAALFPDGYGKCTLLDAGAGIGSLSAAFLDRWLNGDLHFDEVQLDAFEADQSLVPYLKKTLDEYMHCHWMQAGRPENIGFNWSGSRL